jgi:hypothetical protein
MKTKASTNCSVLLGGLLLASTTSAQVQPSLSAADRTAIQELVTSYATQLFACDAEGFADLFVPDTGYFASGFRGHMVGRARLIALVESERHCAPGAAPTNRPGGQSGPTVELEITPDGVFGLADLGTAEYRDEYRNTPQGWKFQARTVIIAAEKAAGLDAADLLAINRLGGSRLGDHYEADAAGVDRLIASGVAIGVSDDAITGRAYLKGGGYNDEVYEQLASGEWRVKSSTHVP